jgi:hypothetical protein
MEIVAADQTRTKAELRQSGDMKGLRTVGQGTGPRSGPFDRSRCETVVRYTACASVRQNPRPTRTGDRRTGSSVHGVPYECSTV